MAHFQTQIVAALAAIFIMGASMTAVVTVPPAASQVASLPTLA